MLVLSVLLWAPVLCEALDSHVGVKPDCSLCSFLVSFVATVAALLFIACAARLAVLPWHGPRQHFCRGYPGHAFLVRGPPPPAGV